MDYKLSFPDDFTDYEWELESKGYFNGAVVVCQGDNYRLSFYDPVRLAQEIEDELSSTALFMEENLVVVSSVDRVHMEKAVKFLMESGKYKDLKLKSK